MGQICPAGKKKSAFFVSRLEISYKITTVKDYG